MRQKNGAEITTFDDQWNLFPFFDTSDKKRISRTCNHIVKETHYARETHYFPDSGVVVGENGAGDYLIFLPDDEKKGYIKTMFFIWLHETGEVKKVKNSLIDLLNFFSV